MSPSVHIFRMFGLSSMRCSSTAQPLDARLGQGGGHRSQQRTQPLREVGLGLRVGLHVARAGHPYMGTQAPEIGPAKVPTDAAIARQRRDLTRDEARMERDCERAEIAVN